MSFSLHELMTFCSRLPSGSQESRVRPFPTDAAPLAGERIHEIKVKTLMLKKAGGMHLQQGDRSQNEVSKTSVTQIFLWVLRNQFRSKAGWGEFVFSLLQGMLRNTELSPTQYIFCVLVYCACLSSERQRHVLY